MIIACTNKGCMQSTEAKLDKGTNQVFCADCGKPISRLSQPIKKALEMFGQIVRAAEQKPFQMRCPTCAAQRDIALSGDVAHCATCGLELHPSAVFLKTYRQHLVDLEKEKKEDQ